MVKRTSGNSSAQEKFDLIVFSHLRWEFVFQRPQHLLTRLSQDRKVIFIEEPIPTEKSQLGGAKIYKANKNVTVVQPRLGSIEAWRYADLAKQQIQKQKIKNYAVWFYSAMFKDVLDYLDPAVVIYDCMDELSAFRGAPKELISNERELMKSADIVFTGGKSLFEAKKKLHNNVYCFPSSVDQVHFAKALQQETKLPSDIKNLPKPVVGYYGVIDERIDLGLLAKIAKALPEVSFVMIGPVAKIAESDLPRSENIFYLGSKDYKQLPNYLKGIDVAMMPFAMNESTKFISPTKTLEYMAALKPIISTPIFDVVRDYKKEVAIVKNDKEFVKAIKKYINEKSVDKRKRESFEKAVLKRTSWDKTAAEMEKIINNKLRARSRN